NYIVRHRHPFLSEKQFRSLLGSLPGHLTCPSAERGHRDFETCAFAISIDIEDRVNQIVFGGIEIQGESVPMKQIIGDPANNASSFRRGSGRTKTLPQLGQRGVPVLDAFAFSDII